MKLILSKTLKKISDLTELSAEVGDVIPKGSIIFLKGDLGSGKTTFVSQFCLLHNISIVQSPTYAIHNRYTSQAGISVDHFDLYRLETEDELQSSGYYDLLHAQADYKFIEWPERAGVIATTPGQNLFQMTFKIDTDNYRQVTLHKI